MIGYLEFAKCCICSCIIYNHVYICTFSMPQTTELFAMLNLVAEKNRSKLKLVTGKISQLFRTMKFSFTFRNCSI